MVKGPGLYSDIGKKARDLLYRDYVADHKFSVTTHTSDGVAITSSGAKKGEALIAGVNIQRKDENFTMDTKVDTNSKLYVTINIDEPPERKTIFSFIAPDWKSPKVESQYWSEYAGITTSIGLTGNPFITFSGVVGTNTLAVGTDLSFDTARGTYDKINAGLSISTPDLTTSLTWNDKGNTLAATYYHTVWPLTNTNIGAELVHTFSSNEKSVTIGTQHALDPLTMVKAKVNNNGKVYALIQHAWSPKSLFTISGEVDTRATVKSAKFGLALALKP
ncbi:unnamed protein product [Cuscuta epithymum]|uniref:Voltage-dependent anion-selective channel protein n=2 Tax=Cuscuta epithymum TaxID=186058 RepID=A0AAV0EI87_9ASTE|nr:unnamed protein product [Cuscuta epithymum]